MSAAIDRSGALMEAAPKSASGPSKDGSGSSKDRSGSTKDATGISKEGIGTSRDVSGQRKDTARPSEPHAEGLDSLLGERITTEHGITIEPPAGSFDPGVTGVDDLVEAVTQGRLDVPRDEARLELRRRANESLRRSLEGAVAEDPSARDFVITRESLEPQLDELRRRLLSAPEEEVADLVFWREDREALLAAIVDGRPGLNQAEVRSILERQERRMEEERARLDWRRRGLAEYQEELDRRVQLLNGSTTAQLRDRLVQIHETLDGGGRTPREQVRLQMLREEIEREILYRQRMADPARVRAESDGAWEATRDLPRTACARVEAGRAQEFLLEEIDLPYKLDASGEPIELVRVARYRLHRLRTAASSEPWAESPVRDAIEELEGLGIDTSWFRARLNNGEIRIAVSSEEETAAATYLNGVVTVRQADVLNGQFNTGCAPVLLHELFHAYVDQVTNGRFDHPELAAAFSLQVEDVAQTETDIYLTVGADGLADEIGAFYVEFSLMPMLSRIQSHAVDVDDALRRWVEVFEAPNLNITFLDDEYTPNPGTRSVRRDFALELARVIGLPRPETPDFQGEEDRRIRTVMEFLLRDREDLARATLEEEREFHERMVRAFQEASADPENAERIMSELISGSGRDMSTGRRFPARLLHDTLQFRLGAPDVDPGLRGAIRGMIQEAQ